MPGVIPGREEMALKDCGGDELGYLIGQSANEIDVSALPERHRIICHACHVTMDYIFDRLNVYLDKSNRVERLTCG